MITIYTDGACSGNPGIGGWGIVILELKKEPKFLNGGDDNTTNNQMELTAAIQALNYFKERDNITLFTDSQYLKNGIETKVAVEARGSLFSSATIKAIIINANDINAICFLS